MSLSTKQSTTSNEATSREKDAPNIVIVYSTSSSPTPFNYALPTVVTRDQVQEMIGQVMDTFVDCQCYENKQFRLSMQNAITTQFSNLGVVLLKNLQQTQMSMLGVVSSLHLLLLPQL